MKSEDEIRSDLRYWEGVEYGLELAQQCGYGSEDNTSFRLVERSVKARLEVLRSVLGIEEVPEAEIEEPKKGKRWGRK